MNLTLKRVNYGSWGIVGSLVDESENHVAVTLEHAYPTTTGSFAPKVPLGEYDCVRGQHTLDSGKQIETFEVTGVLGHAGILFHVGNYNSDSDGCILLGTSVGSRMISASKIAFQKFLKLQDGVNEFKLTIEDT